VPIGALTGWLAVTRMVNVSDSGTIQLDLPGLATFSSSMFLLVFGLIRANAYGWTSPTIVTMFAAAAVLMALFVFTELHQQHPLLDLSLFRKPSFTGVSIGTFAIGAGMFALLPYITFYLQNDLGYSPMQGGLRLLPCTLLCFIVPLAIRSVAEKMSPRLLFAIGLAITGAGLAAMTVVTAKSSWTALIPGLVLTGLGIGIANPMIAKIALGVVAPARSGMASGINNTFRIGGLATGVAALGAVFQQRVTTSLAANLGHPAPQLARVVASAGVRAAVAASSSTPGIAVAAHGAFLSGFRLILVIGAAVVVAGAVAGAALVRGRDFANRTPVAPAQEPAVAVPAE
jgi:Na+/melibiose symporter-like transporter